MSYHLHFRLLASKCQSAYLWFFKMCRRLIYFSGKLTFSFTRQIQSLLSLEFCNFRGFQPPARYKIHEKVPLNYSSSFQQIFSGTSVAAFQLFNHSFSLDTDPSQQTTTKQFFCPPATEKKSRPKALIIPICYICLTICYICLTTRLHSQLRYSSDLTEPICQ